MPKKMLDSVTFYMGGALETPVEGYGYTEPKNKGYTSGSQLFPADGRAIEYRNAQMKTNNDVRVNGSMIYNSPDFFF